MTKKKEPHLIIKDAGRKAIEYRHAGFHCSEATFLAVNSVLQITDPSMVRLVSGFHGGGGSHRKTSDVNLTVVLEELASGRDRRPPEELPVVLTGHLCGALAAGVVCIGFLYGRHKGTDDLTCVDELTYELHRRFFEEFGEKECRPLRMKYIPQSENYTCEHVYRRGAEMAVEVIEGFSSSIPECVSSKPAIRMCSP